MNDKLFSSDTSLQDDITVTVLSTHVTLDTRLLATRSASARRPASGLGQSPTARREVRETRLTNWSRPLFWVWVFEMPWCS